MSRQFAVIVPTFNEVGNVAKLAELIEQTLAGIDWEVIFVDDDSSDGTPDALLHLSRSNPRVRFIRRVGRRGLSSACIEGMLSTHAPYLAVMDADLQHDETLLPEMLRLLVEEQYELVSASRFLDGASNQGLSSSRTRLSMAGIALAEAVIRADLTDPLTGFFALRRELIDEVVYSLSQAGFKILVDIFASAGRRLRYKEIPLHFRSRLSGESKLDAMISLEFITLLIDKVLGQIIPLRFVKFVLVGATGMALHLLILTLLHSGLGWSFLSGQAVATWIAMTFNFVLNNTFTYRDRRLKGRAFLFGLLSFYAICSVGALINIRLADFLYDHGIWWLIAGALGAVCGSVWNFGVSSTFTWRAARKRPSRRMAA